MITREQAEAAVIAENTANNEHFARECRVLDAVEVNANKEWFDIDDTPQLGYCDVEDQGWKVTFEVRDKRSREIRRYGQPTTVRWTEWSEWRKETKYVVEARPGPYVVS